MTERKLPPAEIRWQYLVCESDENGYRPVAGFADMADADYFISSSDGAYESGLLAFEWDERLGCWAPCFLEDGFSPDP